VGSRINYVTHSIRATFDLEYRFSTTYQGYHQLAGEDVKKETLERYLLEQRSQQHSQRSKQKSFVVPQIADMEISKADLQLLLDVDDEDASSKDDQVPQEHNPHNLGQVKQFIMESDSYVKIREASGRFIQTTKANTVHRTMDKAATAEVPGLTTPLDENHEETIAHARSYWHKFCARLGEALRRHPRHGYHRITWTCVSDQGFLSTGKRTN
jgi:hypothetical protein